MINNRAVRDFFKIFKVHLIVEWIFKHFLKGSVSGIYLTLWEV
jgi:hypothetical protein